MFKVIRAEIKKILSRPSIYVLALFLAVILILGNFVYKPNQVLKIDEPIVSSNATINEKYSYFYNGGMKSNLDTELNQIVNSVNLYSTSNSTKEQIDSKLTDVLTAYDEYKTALITGGVYGDMSSDAIRSSREKIIQSIQTLHLTIEQIKSQYYNGAILLLTTKSNESKYEENYTNLLEWANTVLLEKSSIAGYLTQFETELLPETKTCINNFKYPTLSESKIKTYTENSNDTKFYILNNRLSALLGDIEDIKENRTNVSLLDSEKRALIDEKINEYKNQIEIYINLIKYDLLSNAFSFTSNAEQLDLVYLSENYSQYNVNSLMQRYNYLFENNKTENDFALPLTIGINSNVETNAYDYAYFVLRLFSFVIIVFAITTASRTIAGEAQEGTIRFLAIKPISRKDIYLGKLLSILILSVILTIFSSILAVAVGGALYGFDSQPILTIFNGTTPVVIHPVMMLVIYIVSYIIELTIYLSITVLLSSLFKFDVLPLTIVLVLYALNALVPVFVGSVNTWLTYYIFSHISIYALFGSPVFAPTSYDFFSKILGAKIYTGNTFILTLIITISLILLINFIGVKLFKKKEL